MSTTHLSLSWGVSRGRETYGYTICRLTDDSTGKVYRCMGGGYDMVGTVFANWLQDVHQDALVGIADRAYYRAGTEWTSPDAERGDLYGMRASSKPGNLRPLHVYLDGGCGLDSIMRIAKAIGLEIVREYKHSGRNRGETTGWLVTS